MANCDLLGIWGCCTLRIWQLPEEGCTQVGHISSLFMIAAHAAGAL